MANKVVIFFGPDRDFEQLVQSRTNKNQNNVGYLDSIRVYNSRIRASDFASQGAKYAIPEEVDNCIVKASDFGSVLSHVISSFSTILEESFDIDTLFIQNPPSRALNSILSAHSSSSIEQIVSEYKNIDKNDLRGIYQELASDILGQEESKKTLISSLYRLSVLSEDRPSVVLFYGPSGVGKTETAKCISEALGGGLTRVQFSMMQTNEAYDYLFGAEHSKASFARDLLGRESNVVLIDEFDKVKPVLYNMFYQLFDEGIFVDTNYTVKIPSGLFILTSNFSSEEEARRAMGSAMFSRISACVRFEDLSVEDKKIIIKAKYNQVLEKLDTEDQKTIQNSTVLPWFIEQAGRYNNIRTMKNKIEKAVFEVLSEPIIQTET